MNVKKLQKSLSIGMLGALLAAGTVLGPARQAQAAEADFSEHPIGEAVTHASMLIAAV